MPQLTADQLAVIKNDIQEKGWNAHKIWLEHPTFNCSRITIHNQVQKIKETGSKDRRKGSGRPITATTPEICAEVEELICSQEEEPGTHYSACEIAHHLEISRSSVQRMVQKEKIKNFKRITTPQLDNGCRKRRVDRCVNLVERFTVHHLPRLAFQDEKVFTLQVKSNRQNNRVYARK